MSLPPDRPHGFGTPSSDQPGFAPPHGQAAPPVAPQHWAPPDPGLVVAPPPSGRGPRHASRARVRLVAALVATALVLAALLSALPLLPAVSPNPPQSSATPAGVDTVTPSARPGSATTANSGGDLGTSVAFASGAGKGTVTVRSAVWTDTGEMAPEPGHRYLVLAVEVSCTEGTLPVDALMFLATTGGVRALPDFGPSLSEPLGGQVLSAGAMARGQVGFALTPGEVAVQLLDANLAPVARIRIPAP